MNPKLISHHNDNQQGNNNIIIALGGSIGAGSRIVTATGSAHMRTAILTCAGRCVAATTVASIDVFVRFDRSPRIPKANPCSRR